MRRAARNFAISSRKSLCELKKKERRGAKESTGSPAAMAASMYAMALAKVNASSCREVEGDRKAGRALGKEVAVAAIALFGAAEAGVLPHRPEAAAVHLRIDPAGIWKLPGIARRLGHDREIFLARRKLEMP